MNRTHFVNSCLLIILGILYIPLLSLPVQGKELKVQRVIPVTPPGERYMAPVWSPDGAKIAFSRGKYRGIIVMDSDGRNRKELTNESGAGYQFSWSADSQEIAYKTDKFVQKRRVSAIKKVNVTTSKSEMLSTFSRDVQPPHWTYTTRGKKVSFIQGGKREDTSPDHKVAGSRMMALVARSQTNKILYFHSNNIWIMNEDGTGKKQLTKGIGFRPLWSPNREKIIYSRGNNLIVMNPDGSQKIDLGRGGHPSWSPDGKKIVYQITQDDGHRITGCDLYIINADGTGKVQLTNTPSELEFDPSWSPRGNQIAYRSGVDGRIYILTFD